MQHQVNRRGCCIAGAAMALLWAPALLSQTLPPASMSRSGEPDIRLRNIEGNRPPLAPSVPEVPLGAESRAPDGAEQIRFPLTRIEVEGATAYTDAALQPVVAPRYGTTVSLADIYDLAAEIQRRYREDGYFLSRVIVPPQHIADGRVRLEVIEGYVDTIEVQGDIGPVASLLNDYLRAVKNERPLRLATLERSLLLAEDIPGLDVRGVLQPGTRGDGDSRLVVIAQRSRFDGMMQIDNIGSTYTGKWEVAARLAASSFTRFGENIGFTGLLSDPGVGVGPYSKNQKVAMLTGSFRVGARGAFINTLFSDGDANPGGLVKDFEYNSKKTLITLSAVYPLIRARARNLFVDAGFDYIDSNTNVFRDVTFLRDRLRVLHMSAAYDFRDRWRGSSYASFSVRTGLQEFGASTRTNAYPSRFDASGKFTTLRATLSRLQSLGDNWGFYLLTSGQYAFEPVLADEEFDIGGIDFGRGYNPKEICGDSGIGITAEIQYTRPLNLKFAERYQLFGFFDFGSAWQRPNVLVPAVSASLSSAGAGVRAWFPYGVSLEVLVAKPLTLPSQRQPNGTKEPQVLMRLIARF